MASATRTLFRSFIQSSRVIPAKRKCIAPPLALYKPPARHLSGSVPWRADNDTKDSNLQSPAPSQAVPSSDSSSLEEPNEELSSAIDVLENLDDTDDIDLDSAPSDVSPADEAALAGIFAKLEQDLEADSKSEEPLTVPRLKPSEVGFWADDEDDEFGQMEDGDDDIDDSMISAIAETDLDLQRDIRQYTRVAAWDMPLLAKHAKPFELPGTHQVLRFRYTTYMGETHPAEKKVVVEFTTKDLAAAAQLTEPQRIKLIKLVGVRYNPTKDLVRMSSEKHEHPAQNKRYLGDVINKLVTEAKDTTDTLEDIPLDYRHVKPKIRHSFPEEWKITADRVQELRSLRLNQQQDKQQIEAPFRPQQLQQEQEQQTDAVPEYVMARPTERRNPSPGR